MFKELPQIFAKHQKGGLLHLLRQTVTVNIFLLSHLCRSGSASTTGTMGPDAEKKIPSKIAGRWHVITLQEASEYVVHDFLAGRFHVTHYAGCAILFNRTPSTPTSMSSPSTFMTPGETCLIKSWKENRDGHARCSFTCLI